MEFLTECQEDIYLKKGETYLKEVCIVQSQPTPIIQIICPDNPDFEFGGGVVINGLNTCYKVGDIVLLSYPENMLDCDGIEGCYTISQVITQCEYPQTTTLFFEEDLAPSCCINGTLDFNNSPVIPSFSSPCKQPSKCCPNPESIIDIPDSSIPTITKLSPPVELSMEICNRESDDFLFDVQIESVIGCRSFNICPGGLAKCYDKIDIPSLGVIDATITNVIPNSSGHYDTIFIDGIFPQSTTTCLRGIIYSGCMTPIQIISNDNDCCYTIYIPAETITVDDRDLTNPQVITYLGTEDMYTGCIANNDNFEKINNNCNSCLNNNKNKYTTLKYKTSKAANSDLGYMFYGYYKLFMEYTNSLGLQIKTLLSSGKIYVK